jgi:hypothetical protein
MTVDLLAEELSGMTWNEYRKECRMSNVEPVRADFATGNIPECVCYQVELQRRPKAKVMSASAGR